jgi:hypothetical protein
LDGDVNFHLYGCAERDRNPFEHPHVDSDPDEYRRAFDVDSYLFIDAHLDVYAYIDVFQYGVFDGDCHEYGGAQYDVDSDVYLDGCAAYNYGDGDSFFYEYGGA